jgi:lysophospholipase L1-like esterase
VRIGAEATEEEMMSKRVVLIGDSIRMGYQETVRAELQGAAVVVSSEQNGGDSRRVLESLEEWAISRSPDVVHLNCGLHDLKREFGSDEAQVPLDEYTENVEKILTALTEGVPGTVIWANTTPVNEGWHHERKGFDRFEADVVACNRASEAICTRLDIEVNDLHSVVAEAGRDDLLGPDGVHFGEEGYRVLGMAVADAIRRSL